MGKLTLLKSEFHSFRGVFHSVRVRMDEVPLEKSKMSLFSSETIITLNIHSFTLREYFMSNRLMCIY